MGRTRAEFRYAPLGREVIEGYVDHELAVINLTYGVKQTRQTRAEYVWHLLGDGGATTRRGQTHSTYPVPLCLAFTTIISILNHKPVNVPESSEKINN